MTADVADAEGLHRLNLSGTKFRQLLRCAPAFLCNFGLFSEHHCTCCATYMRLMTLHLRFRRSGAEIPDWFAFSSVVSVLRDSVASPNGSNGAS